MATESETANLLDEMEKQIVECNQYNIYSHTVRQLSIIVDNIKLSQKLYSSIDKQPTK